MPLTNKIWNGLFYIEMIVIFVDQSKNNPNAKNLHYELERNITQNTDH